MPEGQITAVLWSQDCSADCYKPWWMSAITIIVLRFHYAIYMTKCQIA